MVSQGQPNTMDVVELMCQRNTSGLGNCGATCYINTIVQCLGYLPDFLELALTKRGVSKTSTPFLDELKEVYKELWLENRAIMPYKFLGSLQRTFGGLLNVAEQNDVMEFLLLYLDKLNSDMAVEIIVDDEDFDKLKAESLVYVNEKYRNLVLSMNHAWLNTIKKEYSPIMDIFYGQSVSQITCGHCQYIHHNYEAFNCISLPIPKKSEKEVTIDDLLEEYFNKEMLNREDKEWTCDKCNQSAPSAKCAKLWKMPKVLVINIKRFDHMLQKKNKPVTMPIDIDLSNHVIYDKSCVEYELTSVGHHIGGSGSGHYVALCRHPKNGWFLIDDENVRKIGSQSDVDQVCSHGYVYFYTAKEGKTLAESLKS